MKKYYHGQTGAHFDYGQPFVLDQISYPANWLECATSEDIANIGLVEVIETGTPGDDKYFVNSEILDGGSLTITATMRPVLEIQAMKWEDIKAERDRRTDTGGYKVGAKWFHSDQKSRSQQLGLVLLGANIPANLQWKTMDGTFDSMTSALAQQILGAAAASDQAIFTIAETHKAAMEASADPSSYDFSTGWPLMFGEV